MPDIINIHRANDYFQHLEVLKRNRNKRHRAGQFLVEGVRNITQALAFGWPVSACIHDRDRPLSEWARQVLATANADTHVKLTADLMRQLSDKDEPSELLCVCRMPTRTLERLPLSARPLVLVFDRPASRGNLGSVIRSCDALHADLLIPLGHGVDPYDPETIRASTGSFFALPVFQAGGFAELTPWLDSLRREHPDLQIVGASAQAESTIEACDFRRATIALVGNETDGLGHRLQAACDTLVRIPMGGSASSLNVACAATVMLYEIDRQRRLAPPDIE